MSASFGFVPDPDNPGWYVRPVDPEGRFIDIFGAIRARVEIDGKVRVRVETGPRHRNLFDQVHGGFTLALVDQALFVGPAILGIEGAVGAATIGPRNIAFTIASMPFGVPNAASTALASKPQCIMQFSHAGLPLFGP